MKTLKKGGELLGKGAYGCVFNIEFPCRKKRTNRKRKGVKYISKVFFHKRAIDEAKEEYAFNVRVKKIKGHRKWSVLWDRLCKPHSYKEIYKKDKKIAECLNITNMSPEEFNERSAMLIGEYGGYTMEKIFASKMKYIKNKDDFVDFFLRTMKRMTPLFEGITALKNDNLSHSDIKRANIVLDGLSFKIIDFGLVCVLDDKEEYKRRAIRQYFDDRIYTPYPIDFVYTFTTTKQENLDATSYKRNEYKNGFPEYRDIHQKIFKRENITDKITTFLKKVRINRKKIFDTIDVYSLGYLIPKCFYSDLYLTSIHIDTMVTYMESPKVAPFISLFKDMTRETFFDEGERLTAAEAHARFSGLIKNLNY